MNNFSWINLFVRDILLSLVICWINHTLDYQSWVAASLAGMMFVLVTWHLNDLIKSKRRLSDGICRRDGNSDSSIGNIRNNLQQNKEPGIERYFGRD